MLSTFRELLKETVIALVLLQVAIFLIGSLIPRSIRKTFKISSKGLYKLIGFIFRQAKSLVRYSFNLYKKQQKNRLPKRQPVPIRNVIDLTPYLIERKKAE